MWNFGVRNLSLALAATLALGSSLAVLPASASVQALLQQQGSLQPAEAEHTFSGQAGQTVVITMTSTDFDTVMRLLDADEQEIASNDDYARTFNSAIVITLPHTGTYKIMARSFSGDGGNYSIAVRTATEYDQAFDRAYRSMALGDLQTALTDYDNAIRLDPSQPSGYLGRADVRFSWSAGNVTDEIIADYRRAAELYEQAGDREMAQSVRAQLESMQNPPQNRIENLLEPDPEVEPMPR
jgi:tetratricopeptide (TPR) repeat protein